MGAPSLHSFDQCLLEEVAEPLGGGRAMVGYYNFCRIQKSLRVTPAMEAGITDHQRELSELLA
jgi:hypothetical protein